MAELVHAVTGEIIDYQPVSPVEVEFIIREIGDRLERAVLILDELQRARYDAESAYSAAVETAKLTSKQTMYSDRRSEAKISCLPLEREMNEAKAKLHHAEKLAGGAEGEAIRLPVDQQNVERRVRGRRCGPMSAPIRVRKMRGTTDRPWTVRFGGSAARFPTGAEALDFVRRLLKAAQ